MRPLKTGKECKENKSPWWKGQGMDAGFVVWFGHWSLSLPVEYYSKPLALNQTGFLALTKRLVL
jgi:hypothetical protein